MSKNLKKITTCLLLGTILSSMTFMGKINVVQADTTETPSYQSEEQIKTKLTEEEKRANEEKLKLAEEYYKAKIEGNNEGTNILSEGDSKSVTFKPVAQEKGYYCGPATAYSVTNGATSQSNFAKELGTETSQQTYFPGKWTATLNKYKPGNNYTASWASSYSDWRKKLKQSIIFTIDNGYPIVADCHITSDSSTWLSDGYKYATDTYHYVTVGGYNDYENTIPAKVLIGDSNTHSGIDRKYWTTLDKITSATKDYGIIW